MSKLVSNNRVFNKAVSISKETRDLRIKHPNIFYESLKDYTYSYENTINILRQKQEENKYNSFTIDKLTKILKSLQKQITKNNVKFKRQHDTFDDSSLLQTTYTSYLNLKKGDLVEVYCWGSTHTARVISIKHLYQIKDTKDVFCIKNMTSHFIRYDGNNYKSIVNCAVEVDVLDLRTRLSTRIVVDYNKIKKLSKNSSNTKNILFGI